MARELIAFMSNGVEITPAARWVLLSSHPCLALTDGVPHRSGPFPPGAFCCTPINSTV